MSGEELRRALMTKAPVLWKGRMEYERTVGYVSAVIYRCDDHQNIVVSCEITRHGSPPSVMRCRPEDVEYWRLADAGQPDGAYTENTNLSEKGTFICQEKKNS